MELYVLDSLLRRTEVLDVYESLIWTDRHSVIGDFELLIESTNSYRELLKPGVKLSIRESYKVMTVETVEDAEDENGRRMLNVKGRSLESILDDRVLFHVPGGGIRMPFWKVNNQTAPAAAREMFTACCINGNVSAADIIPFVNPNLTASLFPADTIPHPSELIYKEVEPASLYKIYKDLLDPFEMGFRLYRDPNTSQLYFNVYSGCDRTTKQTVLPPVVFSEDLETLQKVTSISSIEKSKNTAYVYGIYGGDPGLPAHLTVYQDENAPSLEGFERRIIPVDVGQIPAEVSDLGPQARIDFMRRAGKDALADTRPFQAFDGEINQFSPFKYMVHYNLGDKVEMRRDDGGVNTMRVTEQIFVSDSNGDKAYPTLVAEYFINPGAWSSWKYNKPWADMGEAEFWDIQPD